MYNSASFDKQIESETRNIISKDGNVADALPMLTKSTCKIDVTWFPFDEQKCFLIFGSWSLPESHMLLQSVDDGRIDSSKLVHGVNYLDAYLTATLNGETIEDYIVVPVTLVTKENLPAFDIDGWE